MRSPAASSSSPRPGRNPTRPLAVTTQTAIPISAVPVAPAAPAPAAASPHTRHLATDHLMADLKGRSVRGGAVTLTAQGIKFCLQMGSTMVLARLLTPADFGLIAMVTAVTGFVAMFKDAGLSMATVQRAEITHEQVSTLFWINVALSVLVMLVIAALAPAIAMFYSEPRLTGITLALAATFIFGGLTVQHQALLRRQMRFRALATVEVLSMAAGVATAVAMAFGGFGHWSLVGLVAGQTVANSVLVWVACGWRPGPPRRGSGVRPMLGFGGNLTGFNIVNYFRRNADNLLLGAFAGASALGLYSKAYSLLMLPLRQLNAPLTAVAVPLLSRLVSTPEQYRRAYRRALGSLALVAVPIPLLLLITSDLTIDVLLGSSWAAATPIFRALAVAAVIDALNVATGWAYVSWGHTRRQLYWGLLQSIVVVSAFIIGLSWGALGVAWAYTASLVLLRFPALLVCYHGTPLTIRDFLKAVAPAFGGSVVAALGTTAALPVLATGSPSVIRLLLGSSLFCALYLTVLMLMRSGRQTLLAFITPLVGQQLRQSARSRAIAD